MMAGFRRFEQIGQIGDDAAIEIAIEAVQQ